MKVARFVLKIIAAVMAAVAAVCCIIAFWDKITACLCTMRNTVMDKVGTTPAEYEDYADWDE